MILVGIDSGGSRTRVAVWRDGDRLATDSGPSASVQPGRALYSGTVMATLAKSLLARLGLTRADALVVGAAGAGRTADAEELRGALRGEHIADRVLVTTDVELALAALEPPVGLVVLAGTGTVAIARTEDGAILRLGGLGWQMGDQGGGYWIGRQALEAVGRAHEGRGPETTLTATLIRATNSDSFRDLVGWCSVATPREVAALARLVVDACQAGDPVAQDVLTRAGQELAEMVEVLVRRLRVPRPTLGLSGGLLGEGGPLRRALLAELERRAIAVDPVTLEPLTGAPRLAERR